MTIWKGIKVKPEWLDKEKRDKQTSLLQLQDDNDYEQQEDSEQKQ